MQENWNIGKATAVIPPLKRLPTLLAIQAAQVGPVGAVWDSSGSCPFAAVGQRHLYLRRHRASFLTVSLDTWVNSISLYTIWLLLVANFGELRLREVQLPRIPLPRTPVNTARTCGSHRGGDVSHDIEEAKILAPNGVDGTMPFQKHQRNGAGGVGRGPKHERGHQRADQGAACRRPHHVQGGPCGDLGLLRGHGGHSRGPKRRGRPQAGPRALP